MSQMQEEIFQRYEILKMNLGEQPESYALFVVILR